MFPFNKKLWDFGIKIEDAIKPVIDEKFNADFQKKDDIWDILDFHDEDKKIICEIKGRKIKSSQFPSTIIPMNKVSEGFIKTEVGYKVYFIFVFTDKTMYCELTESLEYEVKLTGTNYIEHACIPIDSLIDIL
tara:strand:- start:160 stop:558 length:399 start_codon:yes stop_codon:yes gene_type:complete